MDSNITETSQNTNKKCERHHEKKKKMEPNANHDADEVLGEVCRKMNKIKEEEVDRSSEASSEDSEDLVNAINYNTITSLAALKDILQGEGNDTLEADSFFQHYFMNHCNNLSSRNTGSPFPYSERRRLSQCREEDEDDVHKESDPPPSTISSESSSEAISQASITLNSGGRNSSDPSVDSPTPSCTVEERISGATGSRKLTENRTVMGAKHKFLVTVSKSPQPTERAISKSPQTQSNQVSREERLLRTHAHNSHTVHFGTKGPEEQRPSVHSIFPGQNLHHDKKYFDSSLIEIRSTVDGSSLSSEDIWVKRSEDPNTKTNKNARKKEEAVPDAEADEKNKRPRAGTWGSQTAAKCREPAKKQSILSNKETPKKTDNAGRRHRVTVDPSALDTSFTRSSQSVGERRRRVSTEEGGHPLYQQTIHGTSGVSRRPALFDMFKRQNKDKDKEKDKDAKKQPSIMKQVRNAMHNMGINTSAQKDPKDEPSTSSTRDSSAHHHSGASGSDATYYHTVMPSTSSSRRTSAMDKMLDILRGRPAFEHLPPPDSVEKRRARAIAQQRYMQQGANLRRASQEAEKRRSSLGHVHMMPFRHRASDASIDPHHAAILFRDARGLPVVDPFMERVSANTLKQDESQIFVKFFKFHKCYDLMPTSAKLLVLDTRLKVKAAFYALVTQGVRAAPLWDESGHTFVGMLTITDFIMILQKYYQSPEVTMEQLEEHRLETWRRVLKDSMGPLIWLDPDASIYDAIRKLIKNRIHRLPIIDLQTGNPLCIITHKRILRFLFLYINDLPKPSYLNSKLRDLKIGTLHNIETAHETTTIKEALTKFVNRRVSALPIVDADGRLKNIYAKFDVINLAASKTYNNLDITLKEATEHRNEWFEGVRKCTLDETLYEVMDRIVKAEVHRLVVVNNEDRVIGIISLSDLLAYIVLRPTGECGNLYAEFLQQCSIDEIEESDIGSAFSGKRCGDDQDASGLVSGTEKDAEPQPSTSKTQWEPYDSSPEEPSLKERCETEYSNCEDVD